MFDNQKVMKPEVTEKLQIYESCNKIVTELIKIRKDAGFSQEFMADWLNVSRKKLNEFENGNFDFELMVNYCDKFSIDLKLTFEIN